MNKYLFLILITGLSLKLIAQEELIPPSPEAASIGSYAEIPVNYYIGAPNINIPLWVVKNQFFSLPISLSYRASGNKVNDIASRVGLGWTLQAGGVITRSVRGMPDDIGYGGNTGFYYSQTFDNGEFQEHLGDDFISYSPANDFIKAVSDGIYDSEPDLFYINCNDISGSFCFDGKGGILLNSLQNLIIEESFTGCYITSWTVRDESGNQYFFDQCEKTHQVTVCLDNGNHEAMPDCYSSWYLSKIITPNHSEITLTYTTSNMSYADNNSEQKLIDLQSGSEVTRLRFSSSTIIDPLKVLWKIVSDIDSIEFISSSENREDIPTKYLDSICIYDKQSDELIKVFDFHNKYQLGNTGAKRLLLTHIYEKTSSGDTMNPYLFEYNEEHPFPARLSFTQDYWGYYNGKTNNYSLLPSIDDGYIQVSGADREPDEDKMNVGILEKITYPTLGYTLFEYEPHDYGTISHHIIEELVEIPQSITIQQNSNACEQSPYYAQSEATFYLTYFQQIDLEYMFAQNGNMEDHQKKIQLLDSDENELWSEAFNSHQYDGSCSYKTGNDNIYLPSGEYQIIIGEPGLPDTYSELTLSYKEIDTIISPIKSKIAGGLRIKKITNVDPLTNRQEIKEFHYRLQDESDRSSGVLLSKNVYYKWVSLNENEVGGTGYVTPSQGSRYIRVYSYPVQSLGESQGGFICYREVEVTYGENGAKGKTLYKFTSPHEYPDYVDDFYIEPTRTSHDYKRGLLTDEIHYDINDSIVKKVIYEYNSFSDTTNRKVARGFKACYAWRGTFTMGTISFAPGTYYTTGMDEFHYNSYRILSAWNYHTIKTIYSNLKDGENPVVSIESYEFNPDHLQKSKVTTINSDNSEIITSYKYAPDYQKPVGMCYDEASKAILRLADKHIVDKPIETTVRLKRTPGSAENVINSKLTIYSNRINSNNDTITLPYQRWNLEMQNPLTDFTESNISSSTPGDFNKDARYSLQKIYHNYDDKGNLIEMSINNDIPISYIWGYNYSYPIAKIENATYDQVKGILLDSLKISYEQLQSQTSEELETIFQALRNRDELKDDAFIHSYTYSPLRGMISETTPNGIKTIYDYDAFGRLSTIRDHNSYILKHFDYNYAREPNR